MLDALIASLAPAAPTPPVLWVRVERPSFDLWGVIVSSLEFVLLSIAVALLLGVVLGWLLIRRGYRSDASGPAALGLKPQPLPGVGGGLGSNLS